MFLIQICSSYHWSVFLDKTEPWFGLYGPQKTKHRFVFFLPFIPWLVQEGECIVFGVGGGGRGSLEEWDFSSRYALKVKALKLHIGKT